MGHDPQNKDFVIFGFLKVKKMCQTGKKPDLFAPYKCNVLAGGLEIKFYPILTFES